MEGQAVLVGGSSFLVLGDGFAVEVFNDEEVDGNAALVSVAGPLGILRDSQRDSRERCNWGFTMRLACS